MQKRITLIGSTGSIGCQTLEVIEEHPEQFKVEILTAGNNVKLLIEQAKKFNPSTVVIANESKYDELFAALDPLGIHVWAGEKAIVSVAEYDVDIVVTALVGAAGLEPTLAAIQNGNAIALANKETLVVAGELITRAAIEYRVPIIPVDSEHSAIFQCLAGENQNPIEKLIITGSGGPFRGYTEEQLKSVTRAEALNHPTWSMGNKITIDSASLMNKGLEVIEAHWLFGTPPEKIEVVIHPQSLVHSLVQFEDGSIKAQLGLPSMKLPIQYALGYPNRLKNKDKRFSFNDFQELTFEQPDINIFRNLALAYEALQVGGNMPCILNAANEVAVAAFLELKISFDRMPQLIETCMHQIDFEKNISLDLLLETDKVTREFCTRLLKK